MKNSEYATKYIRKCKADGLGQSSVNLTAHIIKHFIEWCDKEGKLLESFSEDDVFDYLDELEKHTFKQKGVEKKYSEFTKARNRIQVRKFLSFVNPYLKTTFKIRKPKNNKLPEDIFTKEEVEAMIDTCQNPRDSAIVATFYESGARKGELLAVRIRNIVFDEFGVVVNITEGKTGSRRIRLVFAASYLRQWLDCHPLKDNRDAFVFCSLRSPFGKLSNTGIHDQLKEIGKRAGIPVEKLHPHNFRHTRATHLSEHLTEAQLKEYMGWTKSSTMTSIYTHLSGRDIDNSILRLNGIDIKDSEDDDRLKTAKCPRCKELQDGKNQFCFKCGMPLSAQTASSIEQGTAEFNLEMMKAVMQDPGILKLIMAEIEKQK
ncbi:TPA: tyrosine-type recombinase/integrase [Methanosarcina acetivorans]|uniref:Phage integrase n=2 Tax=Methanosarcina acetivorans TaxID=2214 RepID=Q8TQ60_METAC|nr:tyrosine-type recombinase/integrase [Methanosarcina acetivorans]AAM05099.1 phage integrase [Methanosarcina acetivorans C2A]HIH93030.1 tyrosine-type recombinase/integrase [Methanosarcina acetivorans]